ncbi:polysaccharide deacetylase family protein [Deinococcus sp.]|uniref:polysaccharide deacetylase family protein n=1 Tax=Deinococcus sp. TaxID=47478 RepID=UPI003C7C5E52
MRAGGWPPVRWPPGVVVGAAGLGLTGLVVLVADLLGRQLGLGALGGGDGRGGKVALTFDDGPSAGLPALLDLLARHGVRATFFLTGERAESAPDAVQAMRAAGHELESHGYTHRHALTFAPWNEARQLGWHPEPGRKGKLYRPPWGGHSPFTRWLAWRAGVKVTLWNLESRDWLAQDGATLARELLPTLRGGANILLHDGPDPERSARTLALLEALLPELKVRGLEAVTLAELKPEPIGWREGWGRLREMLPRSPETRKRI